MKLIYIECCYDIISSSVGYVLVVITSLFILQNVNART